MKNEKKSDEEKKADYAFVGLCVLGVGLGLLVGKVAAGAVIGAGLGFLSKIFLFKK